MVKNSLLLFILVKAVLLLEIAKARRIHPRSAKDAWEPKKKKRVIRKAVQDEEELELPERSEHLVTHLPLLKDADFRTKHYAGHIPTTSTERQLFYWLFEPVKKKPDTPLLIWLNGGPGCSSLIGLFVENGPFRIMKQNEQWRVTPSETSWHKLAYMLYIDQPVGTGLSYTEDEEYCSTDEEINEDFYAFLQNFFKIHAEEFVDPIHNRLKQKLYFSGESHAGHYIPSMMNHILQVNGNNKDDVKIKLGGAAIGNGWSEPFYQYSASIAGYAKGYVDFAQWSYLNKVEDECRKELNQKNYNNDVCYKLLDSVIEAAGMDDGKKPCFYDARIWRTSEPYPPNIAQVEAFLGGDSDGAKHTNPRMPSHHVLEAIHATKAADAGQIYAECADDPYYALQHQEGKGVSTEIENILNANIPMLFFNGMEDFICNHVGNEVLLNKLDWNYADEFSTAKRYVWSPLSDVPAGYIKTHRNLSFLKIKDAGHMVPMDQPEVTFAMMKTFLGCGEDDDGDDDDGFLQEEQRILREAPNNVGVCEKYMVKKRNTLQRRMRKNTNNRKFHLSK